MTITNPDIITRGTSCPVFSDPEVIQERHADILTDESRMDPGIPRILYLPRDTLQTARAVHELYEERTPIVTSGGRTGITGGAVSRTDSALISLEAIKPTPTLRFFENRWILHVGAGATVEDITNVLDGQTYEINEGSPTQPPPLIYPVDPTERSASVGGTVSTNASGARTLGYGPTRDWVHGIVVVLADGRVLSIQRGELTAENGSITIPDGNNDLVIPVRDIPVPGTKHTAGYHCADGMDLVDLFVGSEGTLGLITEVDLYLTEPANETLYLTLFLKKPVAAELAAELVASKNFTLNALEYMDGKSLDLLRNYRDETGESSGVPEIPDSAREVLYLEHGYESEDIFEELYGNLENIVARYDATLDDSWAGFSRSDEEAMKAFRHALPEKVNSTIAQRKQAVPEITKVGTDMAVPLPLLGEMIDVYRKGLADTGLEYCIFGHIGNGHLHVNILPKSVREYRAAQELYIRFAEAAVSRGGSVAAEHGIGRLKKKFMGIQYTDEQLDAMRMVKTALDPDWLLNAGVLIDRE